MPQHHKVRKPRMTKLGSVSEVRAHYPRQYDETHLRADVHQSNLVSSLGSNLIYLFKWDDKSTTSYEMLDLKSYIKNIFVKILKF